jgi:hypothetical protein
MVKWNLLRDAAILGHSEEALVRIVVPIRATSGVPDREERSAAMRSADAVAQNVAQLLMRDVTRVLPASARRRL